MVYYLPTGMLNALAFGSRRRPAIAVSDGLLRSMDLGGLAEVLGGVLAHELSHVRHNDMWVMILADMVSRLISAFSLVALLPVFVNLLLLLFTDRGHLLAGDPVADLRAFSRGPDAAGALAYPGI